MGLRELVLVLADPATWLPMLLCVFCSALAVLGARKLAAEKAKSR
jgi:hypothetical protein